MFKACVRDGSSRARLAQWLCACLLLIGCGDDAPANMEPDGGLLGVIDLPPVGDFDANVEEEPGPIPDSSTPDSETPEDAETPEPDAAVPPDFGEGAAISGVTLTNAPHIGFRHVGEDALIMVTANFIIEDTDGNGVGTVWMYGDVENQGAEMLCQMLTESFVFDYGEEQLVVITGNPYKSLTSGSAASTECIEPGDRAVWNGLILDTPADFIEKAQQLTYDFDGSLFFTDYQPSPYEPAVLYVDPRAGDLGWFISGLIRTRTSPIYNVGIDFFARSRNGLIFDDTTVYPEDLGTLDPNTTIYYQSPPFFLSDELPDTLSYFVGYIEGTDPGLNFKLTFDAPEDSEHGRRTLAVARARRALRDAKERASLGR